LSCKNFSRYSHPTLRNDSFKKETYNNIQPIPHKKQFALLFPSFDRGEAEVITLALEKRIVR
jgi:predicted nucleic acid-binding protein